VKDDLGLAADIDFSKMEGLNPDEMAEASKLFEDVMKEMSNTTAENPVMENPFLMACSNMFKDFENIEKEEKNKTTEGAKEEEGGEDF
jgi:hypothetical protein